MDRSDLDRRDFHRLAMAAFGGIVTGSMAGCGNQGAESPPTNTGSDEGSGSEGSDTSSSSSSESSEVAKADPKYLMEEPHVCRGLNTCKGKGAGGDNDCAGQGTCATAEKHSCHGENECKGQGGCGTTAGQNSCEGKGECGVPLNEKAWKMAREAFEKIMKENGKEVGPAPAKA